LGVDKYEISVSLRKLLDDCNYWIDHEIYPGDEIAIRFKHRLVSIHCFPNGNGRHSRLIADVVFMNIFEGSFFTWGSSSITRKENTRTNYLAALKKADLGDIEPLLAFATS